MTKVKTAFGIAIPQMFPDGNVDPPLIRSFLSQAESLGYHSAWVQDHLLGDMPALDPITLLSYSAAASSRIKLGTSVILSTFRNPILLAKRVATLDQLSGGRVILGIGLGGYTDVYPAFGLSAQGRVSRFEDGLSLMKKLWTEKGVTLHSRFWNMDDLSVQPKPFQNPYPPIWFGGYSEPALRRAIKLGDGWMGAGAVSTSAFHRQSDTVRRFLAEADRNPATFAISKRVYMAVDDDKPGAVTKLRDWFGLHYGNASLADKVSIIGNEQECLDGLAEVLSLGIDLIILNPVYNVTEQSERLAKDILPKLNP